MHDPKVIVALDFDNENDALTFVHEIAPSDCRLKVGKELFTTSGPDIVKRIQDLGFDVFLDLKFHDIPATVEKACRAAAKLGVWMLNVHALGGMEMMRAAKLGVTESGTATKLIAVTILTSHSQTDLDQIGLQGKIADQVLRLATMSSECGMEGVVCSAQETKLIREAIGEDFLLVTPGIRPPGSATNDQSRIVTPKEALDNGSSYLVIGRPITQSKDPGNTLKLINQSIN